jgi:hypothetical protein
MNGHQDALAAVQQLRQATRRNLKTFVDFVSLV